LYSRLQNDVEQASAYYFKSVQLASLLFFPLMWGFSSVAPEFVDVILGDKWTGATVILQVLTLAVPFRVLSILLGPLVNGLGRPGLGTRNLLTYTVLMTPAIAVGTQWGLTGVCVGLVAAQMVAWIINFRRSLVVVDRTVNQLLVILAPSVASAAVDLDRDGGRCLCRHDPDDQQGLGPPVVGPAPAADMTGSAERHRLSLGFVGQL
jgi:O-antigen/teichoic acid export membrane protein